LQRYAGIYHVPLYGYALGGWLKLFGDSIAAVRSFTLFCLVVAWALGLRILAQVCRALKIRFQAPGLFYSLVLLTSAYYIESSVLPDIDGTVLIVFFLGTITLLIDWMRLPTWKHALWSGVLLGLCLLSKMTTTLVLFLLAPIATWCAAPTGTGKRWAQALLILASATAVFAASWGAFAHAFSFDFWYPFRFSLQSASKGTAGSRLAGILYNLRSNTREILWLGYPLCALLAIGVGRSVMLARQWPRARGPLLVVAGGAMLVFGVYAVIIGPVFWFSKYYVVAVPLAAVTVAVAMGADGVLRLAREEVLWLLALFVVGVGWMAVFEKDLALFPDAKTLMGMGHRASPWIAALLLTFGIADLWRARRQERIGRVTFALLPLVLLAVTQGIGTAWAQARADYSTRYYYGERGFQRVVALLEAELRPGEAIFSAKDVGAATGHPFHEEFMYLYDPTALGEFLAAHGPRFVVTRKKFEFSMDFVPGARQAILRSGYHPWVEVDDFTIWRRDRQAVK
jgi:4-amino-4-deoxy-L-arabinose transferase-like glycosyltransferase